MYFPKENAVRKTKGMLELQLYQKVLSGCMIANVCR